MGTTQPFRTTADWDQAVNLLDSLFPLTRGSHGTVKGYLLQFDHLVCIQENGESTCLKHPKQFIEAGGNVEAPTCIVLGQNGIEIEIEPATHTASVSECGYGHRMQLITSIEAA